MVSRRHVLSIGSLGIASLAGCFSLSANDNDEIYVDSLTIHNEDNETRELAIELTEDDEELFRETVVLDSQSGESISNPVDGNGDYTITGRLDEQTVQEHVLNYADGSWIA